MEPEVRLTTADVLAYLKASDLNQSVATKFAHELYRNTMSPELASFLREHGFRIALQASDVTKVHLTAIEKVYRAETLTVLTTDPFQCIGTTRGMNYQRASGLWRRLCRAQPNQGPVASAAIREVLRQGREHGHIWLDESATLRAAQAQCGLHPELIQEALSEFLSAGVLTAVKNGHQRQLVRSASLESERDIASRLLVRRNRYAACDRFDVYMAMRQAGILEPDPLQIEAVACAMEHQTVLITGGPGTGKSTILSAIAAILRAQNPAIRIKLVALAARVARAIGAKTDIDAETIHTTLGLGGGSGAAHGPGDPLQADVVILEEAFMPGNSLFGDLLKALGPDTRLILVGDPEQLPPIAEGKPVECILSSETIPTVRLETNHRSSAQDIPAAGKRIMRGLPFRQSENVHLFETRRYDDAIAATVAWFDRMRDRGESVQILTAMHEGPLGTLLLNRAIAGRHEIGIGDTVMQTHNDRDRGILNGEIGIVIGCTDTEITVERDDGDRFVYANQERRQLVHAWAISYHKAQGLEYDHVILVTSASQKRMMSRNLINVGITRAKRSCLIIDHSEGLRIATESVAANRRTTMLDRLLRGESIQ